MITGSTNEIKNTPAVTRGYFNFNYLLWKLRVTFFRGWPLEVIRTL